MSERKKFLEKIPDFYKKAAVILVCLIIGTALFDKYLAGKESKLLAAK